MKLTNCDVEEFWKDVEGYEGIYRVSNLGRVESLGRFIRGNGVLQEKRFLKGRFLKAVYRGGYLCVDLSNHRGGMHYSVSRLVAKHFVINTDPDNKIYVNHIDGDKKNNVWNNLEWCTPSENSLHAWNEGLQTSEGHYTVLTESQVYSIRWIRQHIHPPETYWRILSLSIGCSFSTVKNVVNGQTWKHVTVQMEES